MQAALRAAAGHAAGFASGALDWLPARLRATIRKILPLALIALLIAAAGYLAVTRVAQLGRVETYLIDYRINLAAPARPQHPGVALVEITEDTIARFPYRAPVDRKFLAELLKQIEAKGARGVAVDVIVDQTTEAEKDELLARTIAEMKIPVVFSYANTEDDFMTEDQAEYIDEFLPEDKRGYAWMKLDFDGTARTIYAGRPLPSGRFVHGLPGSIAEKLGYAVGTHDQEIDFWKTSGTFSGTDQKVRAFPAYPAHALGFVKDEWIRGRVVFVGANLTLVDRYRTPLAAGAEGNEGQLPGVEIHAHAFAQLMDGRIHPTPGPVTLALCFLAMAAIGMALGALVKQVFFRLTAALAIILGFFVLGFLLFRYGLPPVLDAGRLSMPTIFPILTFAVALWLSDVYAGRAERQQKKFIQQAFTRYLSPALLEEITKDPTKLSLDAQRREMSFIFTDVAGFTTLSEKIDAAHLAQLLNRYLDGVCRVIFQHGGTVDKFIGDAVFAIFNAPRDQPDHAARAVACAIQIDLFSDAFNQAEIAAGGRFGMTRIGVHTGFANVGNFGSDERFEYTALGDAVNTAARLEGLNKYLGTRVCISEAAARDAGGVLLRPCGAIVLKGKSEPIEVFEPLTPDRSESDFMMRYRLAYDLMATGDPGDPEALDAFTALHAEDPQDGPTLMHLERLRAGHSGTRVVMEDK